MKPNLLNPVGSPSLNDPLAKSHNLARVVWLTILLLRLSHAAGEAGSNVLAWGWNTSGQTDIPTGLSNVVTIAAGANHVLALRADGTVAAWGWNAYGQADVPAGLENVVAIAAGGVHSMALQADGKVIAWGQYFNGSSNVLMTVPASLSNVAAIACGFFHSLALCADGTVVSWGSQTQVPAGLSNVVAIAGGVFHSLALRADGKVISWGEAEGVPAGLSNVVAIAGGDRHSLALRGDGKVVAWGWNDFGEATVPAGLSNVVAIAGLDNHHLALRADGTVAAWGANRFGETTIPAGLSNVVAIATGGGPFSLALVGTSPPGPLGPVALTLHPFSQRALAGETVTLRVMAVGITALSYQWQFNGTNIPGSTNASLPLKKLTVSDGGGYRVLVSNARGTTYSHTATLTVCDFAISPTRIAFNFQGGSTNLNVVASSSVCPWTVENSNNWIFISSAVSGLGSGAVHCLLASNRTANSRSGTITVGGQVVAIEQAGVPQKLLPQIARQPEGKTFTRAGETFTLHVEFKKHPKPILPYTYQWYFNGAAIPGETRARLVLKHIQPSNAGEYHIVVSNPFGDVTSAAATIRFVLNLSNRSPGSRPVPLESRDSLRDYFPELESATTAAMGVPPVLRHLRAPDGQLILNWDPGAIGFRIQKSFNLIDPDWQNVPESERTNAIKLPITDSRAYFRLIGP